MTELSLQVEGMSCAVCVGKVQRTLEELPFVEAPNVNLANENARLSVDDPADVARAAAALKRAGYPVVTDRLELAVDGLSDAASVAAVERALAACPGVLDAHVNLATETATVTIATGAVQPSEIARVIAATGFTARLRGSTDPGRDDRKQREKARLGWRTLLAAALALPVFVMEMGGHLYPPFHGWTMQFVSHPQMMWAQFLLTTAVLVGPGRHFYLKGIPALLRGAPDMNALVAVGTLAAWSYSTLAAFRPWLFPAGAANVYFESAAVIVVLILFGRWMEARAKGRTGAAIRGLMRLQPKTARVERGGTLVDIPTDALKAGDVFALRPGEAVATDGTILSGESYLDESMVTGEPVPVAKAEGASVTGGTINTTGALRVRAERVGADTVLAQIIRLVEQAQGAKLPVQSLVDRITRWFVPAVMAAAALTTTGWLVFGPQPALAFALVAGVSVLVIACPCAMGLATPTSIMVGTGRGAELGVLFRRGDALQALEGVRVVAFDKTGTLTEGRPALTDMQLADGFAREDLLAKIAAAEAQSEHPIAAAIVRAAEGLALPQVARFRALPGYGVKAEVGGQMLVIGAERLMDREKIETGALAEAAAGFAAAGKTPLFAAVDGRIAAAIAVEDPIKPGTPDAIAALHAQGIEVAMITGDNAAAARAVADRLGIDHVTAEVLPRGKVKALEALREAHGTTAFTGDGINDAPALAAADVGIAIGTGTDVAIDAADVVLVSGDLGGAATAINLSRRTMRNIRQNLFWAFGYNVVLIPVAAGLLYPATGLMLSPMLAAFAMAMSSVFVLSNALRLRFVGVGR